MASIIYIYYLLKVRCSLSTSASCLCVIMSWHHQSQLASTATLTPWIITTPGSFHQHVSAEFNLLISFNSFPFHFHTYRNSDTVIWKLRGYTLLHNLLLASIVSLCLTSCPFQQPLYFKDDPIIQPVLDEFGETKADEVTLAKK